MAGRLVEQQVLATSVLDKYHIGHLVGDCAEELPGPPQLLLSTLVVRLHLGTVGFCHPSSSRGRTVGWADGCLNVSPSVRSTNVTRAETCRRPLSHKPS